MTKRIFLGYFKFNNMRHSVLYIQLFLYLFIFSFATAQTLSVKGIIIDKKTNQPLPYSSVVVKNKFQGTISGINGKFNLIIPDSLANDTLQVNHLGYKTFETPINKISSPFIKIKLKNSPTNIEAVIIKPLKPEDILRQAIRNISENYPQSPFISEGFYMEKLKENDEFIKFAEGYVEIYSTAFGDTSACQAKLIEGRTRDSLGQIKFMETIAQKKYEKRKRKSIRRGDTINSPKDSAAVNVIFSGPKSALLTDFVRDRDLFLDSTKLGRFDLSYENDNILGGKELYVIRCKNKRAIDNLYLNALVYIDKETYAIAKITSTNTIKIPGIAKPLLSLYRIKVGKVEFNIDNEYRKVNQKWYPTKVLLSFTGEATKKYRGGKFDYSLFDGMQAFTTTDIKINNVQRFSKEEEMTDESLSKQLGEYNSEFWLKQANINYQIEEN